MILPDVKKKKPPPGGLIIVIPTGFKPVTF